jgi:hypothetical protein
MKKVDNDTKAMLRSKYILFLFIYLFIECFFVLLSLHIFENMKKAENDAKAMLRNKHPLFLFIYLFNFLLLLLYIFLECVCVLFFNYSFILCCVYLLI